MKDERLIRPTTAAGSRRPDTVIRCNVLACGGALRVGGMIAAEGRHRNKVLATRC